ncbi:hypothetical protein GIB67_014287, partial [Kingdonia uniflora]
VWVGLVLVDFWGMGFYGGELVGFVAVSISKFSCGADLKPSFRRVSIVGVAIGLRLFTVVVDVTMTPEIPLRPILLRVVITDPFFPEVENKGISKTSLGVLCVLEAWSLGTVIVIGGCLECWFPCGSAVSPGLLVLDELLELTRKPSFSGMRLLGLCSHLSSRFWADLGVVFDWGIWAFGGETLGFDVISERAA